MPMSKNLFTILRRESTILFNNLIVDCKCREIHHGATPEQCAVITGTIQESYKKDSPKDKCSKEPSSKPCLCHAHKIRAYTLPLKCRTVRTLNIKSIQTIIILNVDNNALRLALHVLRNIRRDTKYYRTTDSPPILATEKCAEKTDQAATRFWAEIFGTIHIGTAFITAFVLQLVRFILYSIIRPLTVGILQLLADYFIKPLLSIVFNTLIQPVLILLYNIATSCKDLCEPIAEAIGLFLREIAHVCAAIRVVEVKQGTAPSVACT
ncbi:hypothetical protein E2986_00002 [Frieseomelitta varia]|uniref:Uncharacterized protein n=1 Tax=Frieseomelitta varia TaxID=561572 RepID=A0A833VVH3_9HYME|nr:hypothetical protein E2986_00002 [Frieseomelitta varia]